MYKYIIKYSYEIEHETVTGFSYTDCKVESYSVQTNSIVSALNSWLNMCRANNYDSYYLLSIVRE